MTHRELIVRLFEASGFNLDEPATAKVMKREAELGMVINSRIVPIRYVSSKGLICIEQEDLDKNEHEGLTNG